VDEWLLDEKMKWHFDRVRINERLSRSDLWEVYQVHTEDFLEDPLSELKGILQFLGVAADEAYLACTKIVMKRPKRTSQLIEWPAKYVEAISAQIHQAGILERYRSSLPFGRGELG
jgi:hypothetical protein